MWRFLNMFIIVGLALIGISILGFASGSRFLTEPGQEPNITSSVVYLGAGILMLLNGVLSIKYAPPAPPAAKKQNKA